MKKILCLFTLAALALSFSSCCSLFGTCKYAGTRTESNQVKAITNNGQGVYIAPDSKTGIGGLVESSQPVTLTEAPASCPNCTSYYKLKKGCCGSNTEDAIKRATAQGPVGSPHIGLIPTMKKLAE